MTDEGLKSYFKFDDADLHANRAGRFSPKKASKLAEWKRSMVRTNLVTVGVLTLLLIWAGYGIVEDWGDPQKVVPIAPWFILVLLIIIRQLWVALRKVEPKVDRVLGPISIIEVERVDSERRKSSHHEMRVGGQSFRVYPHLADSLKQGDIYGVYYYIYNNKEVLSMELISRGS